MRKVSRLQDKWQNVAFSLSGVLIIVADQFSKTWIRDNLSEGWSLFESGYFRIVHVHNTGAAFGLLSDQSSVLAIVGLTITTVILAYVLVLYRYFPWFNSRLGKLALGLIVGGTVGNLIDRLRFGYVTDFIDFDYWAAFNVADSAVTVGSILLAYILIRLAQAENTKNG